MALVNDGTGNMVMPVAPMSGYGNGGYGFGGDGSWWVILFLFCLMGGWGNGFGGYGGGTVPYMMGQTNTNNDVQRGFDQSAVMTGINGISNAITAGFGNVQTSLCNGFSQAEIAANSRQMADMNQMFGIQSALQNCCCENRAATADLKYTVATEACADRAAVSSALRDVIESNTASTQKILDQLCQDKIDAKNEKIADLQNQLTMANLAASQNAQTAALVADNTAQTQYIINRVAPYPIPAYQVANPYGYGSYANCGCTMA